VRRKAKGKRKKAKGTAERHAPPEAGKPSGERVESGRVGHADRDAG